MPWHGRADGMLSESNSAGKLLMHLLDLIRLRLLPPAHILPRRSGIEFSLIGGRPLQSQRAGGGKMARGGGAGSHEHSSLLPQADLYVSCPHFALYLAPSASTPAVSMDAMVH